METANQTVATKTVKTLAGSSSPTTAAVPEKLTRLQRFRKATTENLQRASRTILSINQAEVEYDFEEKPTKSEKQIPPQIRRTIACAKKPRSDECSGIFGPYTSLFLFSFGIGLIFGPLDVNAIYIVSWFILIEFAYFLIYGYSQPETPVIRGVTFLSYLLGFIVSRTFTVYSDVLESRAITTINESQIYVPLDDVSFAASTVRNASAIKENFVVLSNRIQKWLVTDD